MISRREIKITESNVGSGYFSAYDNLQLAVIVPGDSNIEFQITFLGQTIKKRCIRGTDNNVTLLLSDVLDKAKKNQYEFQPFGFTGVGIYYPLMISYTVDNVAKEININIVDSIDFTDTFNNSSEFITSIRNQINCKNFEQGVYFFGVQDLVVTANGVDTSYPNVGTANDITFFSTRGVEGLERVRIAGQEGVFYSEPPCSEWELKLVKFKGSAGQWEYLPFYAKDETRAKATSARYLQFEDGYKNINGDIQTQIELYRDDFKKADSRALELLNKNQNVWYSEGWQISDFTTTISNTAAPNFALSSQERLVKADLSSDEITRLKARIKEGERVTLLSSTQNIGMWGVVQQYTDNSVYLKFSGTYQNDNIALLDTFISSSTNVRIATFDAWELCTVANKTVDNSNRLNSFVRLSLITNNKTNYNV